MEKLRTYVFLAIVILIISFGASDEAESKLMEIDRRLKRAVEAWRNGTSLTRADSYLKSKCQRTKFEAESGGVIGTFIPSCESDGTYSPTQFWGSTGYSWCALADGTEVPGTRTRPGVARNTDCSIYREPRGIYANIPHLRQSTPYVVKYGCFWSRCWRSCRKGEQDPSGYFKKKNPPEPIETWHEFCQNDEWCYSDLGTCSTDARCKEAPKWGCYGTGWGRPDGLRNGRVVIGDDDAPCPIRFKGYYCDTKTGRSFGCSDSLSRMWRSCDAGEDGESCKDGYCFVDSGYCTYDIKSIVATVLDCV